LAFALDPSGNGGAAVCQQFDAEKEERAVLVFDAFDVARGPVAKRFPRRSTSGLTRSSTPPIHRGDRTCPGV
jgi:carotenoid cleavage dioxygenase-like enzyme